MVSLIGNTDAFTSFSFGNPIATAPPPAPINTGQTFVARPESPTPTITNTNPSQGLSSEDRARIAFKDEENIFTKEQKIGIYEVGQTLDKHQDDIQDHKQKLVRIQNTTDGVIVSSKVRASGFEIDDGSITDVKTTLTGLDELITNNKTVADNRHTELTTLITTNKSTADANFQTNKTSIENNKTVADTRHTELTNLITTNKSSADTNFQTNKTSIENNKTAIENNKTTADTNHTNLTTTVTNNKTLADTNHTTLNNLITTANANITSLESDTTTHNNRLNALEDTLEKVTRSGNNLHFDNDIVLASGRTFKYDKSGVETDLITQLESIESSIGSSRTDAELTTFIDSNTKVSNTAEKTGGFTRDTATNKTTFTDKIIADIMTHGTYVHSTGFRHLFPEFTDPPTPRFNFPLFNMDIVEQIGSLIDMAALNTELAIMFNLRLNGRSASNGGQGYEYMFGMPQAGFDHQTANTMRLMGEEIFIGRPSDLKITEAGQENNIENTEIPLIATLNNLITFRDGITTTIDARLTTVTTSISNDTISSLIDSSLAKSGLDSRITSLETRINRPIDITNLMIRTNTNDLVVNGSLFMGSKLIRLTYQQPSGGARSINVTEELGQATDNIADIQAKLATIPTSANLTSLTNKVTSIEGQIANFATSANLTSLSNTVTSLNTTVNDNKTAFDNLNLDSRVTTNTNNHTSLTNSVTSLSNTVTALNTTVNNNKTAFDNLNLDTRVTTNTNDLSTLKNDVDDIENITDNMSLVGGVIKIQSNVLFQADMRVRTDIPTTVHLGKGEVLYNFASGEADIPTKIVNIEDNTFFQTPNDNSGKILKCDNVNVLRGSTYLPVLTADDFRELLINNVDAVSGTVQQNTVLIAGPNLVIPKSPNPIVFVDSDGRLGSSSLSEARYDDQVFGADNRGEDNNAESNNLAKFQHGLVPSFVSEVSGGKKGGTVRVGSSIHVLTASGSSGSSGGWRKLSDIFVENGVSTVSVSENLPDFQPITKNNQFALCSQVNGGTIFYADIDTSFVAEHASRLYHTPERVNTLINTKVSDGSITNAVISHIESQTLTAVSDKRLKRNIKDLDKNIENLDPVEFEYKNDIGKKRYGLIAQDVKKNYPELVETDIDGKLSIKYLDIIGLLIKDNQELRKKINKIEKFLEIK